LKYGALIVGDDTSGNRTEEDRVGLHVAVSLFDRLVQTRICPECSDLMRLYVTPDGIPLLACMGCQFERVDGDGESLDSARELAVRDRGERRSRKMRGIKKRGA
jgi:hypothetical protein